MACGDISCGSLAGRGYCFVRRLALDSKCQHKEISMKKLATLVCAACMMAAAAWAQGGVSLPAGTALKVKLETTLTTANNKAGDPFSGRVTEPVVVDGKTVVPIGTTVEGR